MAFTLIQAGTTLRPVNTDGALGAALTLPSGITLVANRVPRFACFQNYVVVVNTPTRPVSVGTDGTVRPLTPAPPSTQVILTATGSGVNSGNYLAEHTYVIKDAIGNDITESDYSPIMASSVATATQQLNAAYAVASADSQVNTNRLYRTDTGPGSDYFPWFDVPDNSTTSITLNTPDASLGLVAKPARGSAPDLTLICSWEGRLWGVDRLDIDNLRYTEAGTMFAWSGLNELPIPHLGDDRYGIIGLAPRQNMLGVGRRNSLLQVVGSTTADFRAISVSENCGFLSQETVVIYRDIVFFLWLDGVYQWDGTGVTCISDLGNVRSWFATDAYFNRGMFSQAFAVFDPIAQTYRLFLCSSGQTQTDQWVEFSLRTSKWYGPHQTDAFSPSCAVTVRGTNDQPFPMIGAREGYLSQDVAIRSDWSLTPIAEDVIMCANDCDQPDMEKYFGEVSIHGEPQSGGTLTIDAIVGELDADMDDSFVTMTHDLTVARERLFRLGEGKFATLRFRNSELGRNVVLYGYNLPYHVTGRR